jgi:RHS repeat-associated protein
LRSRQRAIGWSRTWSVGPWYYKIGNRLAETRNGATDSYQYQLNAGSGNTPILDLINLAVTGTRDYTWGPAGHLEEVAAGANVLDFGADAEGRLSGVDRTAAAAAASFSYDGRSFLQTAQETAGGTSSVDPLYDSAGLAHALRRHPSPTDPEEIVVFVYLAGRPVAQLAIDGAGAETWTYLSTDHLGTPLLATADTGTVVWEGGFEPFGRDYQAGTPAGALESQVYLRLPGQWQDTSWQDASSGAGIYYNVHRWYAPGTGTYTRPDPARLLGISDYVYALGDPISISDSSGLLPAGFGADDTCLICTVYAEARGQSAPCQQAVASAIINRFINCGGGGKGGSSLCEIVSKPGQFDGYGDKNYQNCEGCSQVQTVPELPELLMNLGDGFPVEPDADFFVNNNPADIRRLLRHGLRVDPVPFGGCQVFAFYKTRPGVPGGYCR